ncbi:D-xylulose reductase [Serratia marcescens]|uniref:D-xylulose reductase n=1 Tax=Serratia marcescens TaxID=615 RepID=A0A379ZE74_SERMA|nr:D-xylulose reductase [Serratia marcescens]
MQAATKAGIKPGDIALVIGAGPIGVVTALAALAGGCSDVIICDLFDEKLAVAASYEGLHAVNIKNRRPGGESGRTHQRQWRRCRV